MFIHNVERFPTIQNLKKLINYKRIWSMYLIIFDYLLSNAIQVWLVGDVPKTSERVIANRTTTNRPGQEEAFLKHLFPVNLSIRTRASVVHNNSTIIIWYGYGWIKKVTQIRRKVRKKKKNLGRCVLLHMFVDFRWTDVQRGVMVLYII